MDSITVSEIHLVMIVLAVEKPISHISVEDEYNLKPCKND